MSGYVYFRCCVEWPGRDVSSLCNMILNQVRIKRKVFLRHVNHQALAQRAKQLGYCEHHSQGLTMAGDRHVTYHRSKLHGKTVYYFQHSSIEHVFVSNVEYHHEVSGPEAVSFSTLADV